MVVSAVREELVSPPAYSLLFGLLVMVISTLITGTQRANITANLLVFAPAGLAGGFVLV